MLLDRPPFYVAGLVLGLCVVTLFALINRRLGVTGGFSDLVERASGRTAALGWPAFFVFGVAAGGCSSWSSRAAMRGWRATAG